jgi:two-component system NtrC family sensor kinase
MDQHNTQANLALEENIVESFQFKLVMSCAIGSILSVAVGFAIGGAEWLYPAILTSVLFIGVAAYTNKLLRQAINDRMNKHAELHREQEQKLAQAIEAAEQLKERLENNKQTLVHAEKMASLGQLAAGVAHEINNPVGFVMSNLCTFKEYIFFLDRLSKQLLELLGSLNKAEKSNHEKLILDIETTLKIEDLDYIISDSNSLIEESLNGGVRIKEIVSGLKGYAHTSDQTEDTDVNELIEQTLHIVWNQIKYNCTLEKDLTPIPSLRLAPGAFNQVLLNLLMNASHAMEGSAGTLTVRSFMKEDDAVIEISDTGCGIAEENLKKIFDPFFTTKAVGEGTGLGMSICYDIVTGYGGKIEVVSELEKGTKFSIFMPTKPSNDEEGTNIDSKQLKQA